MRLQPRPQTAVLMLSQDTPIADALETIIGADTLATWNPTRGTGGEWDTLRAVPLRTRQRLTSAGYLSRHGMAPDVFSDLLTQYGGAQVGSDPIAWYVRTALQAMAERRAARRRARETALARSTGHSTLFYHRDKLAQQAGYRSYYDYRMRAGWGDGHGRYAD